MTQTECVSRFTAAHACQEPRPLVVRNPGSWASAVEGLSRPSQRSGVSQVSLVNQVSLVSQANQLT